MRKVNGFRILKRYLKHRIVIICLITIKKLILIHIEYRKDGDMDMRL
jgi:hypothetical protein